MSKIRRRAALVAAVAATTSAGLLAWTMIATVASAAVAGCQVSYAVPSQWGGGFTASITIKNVGDPISSWSLKWTFPAAGQSVAQGWNASYSQSGSQVTATSLSYNGSIPAQGSTSIGFNGSWSGSNPAPTTFTLNGVTCTGSVTSPSPTASPTASPTPTPTPSSSGWNPPASLVQPLNEVWNHVESTYPNLYGFRNYGWDQVLANRGNINYCVRWDSSSPVTAAQRDQIHSALQRQFKKWMDVMAGHNAWPYATVPVKVVGWAVRDRNTLQWSDSSVDIYVNNIRENAPQCAEPCGRFFHQDGNYSGCPGGASHHYDQSLWLTSGFGGGAGGDWGQRISSEYMVSNVNAENIHILLHGWGIRSGLTTSTTGRRPGSVASS